MNRLFKFLTSIVALALLSLPCTVQALAADAANEFLPVTVFKNLQDGKKQAVVVYGTSLTIKGAWVGAVKRYFDDLYPDKVTLVNAAKAGMTSDWGVANLQERVLANNPDLVFVEFSMNDAATKSNITLEKSAANLDSMVKALRAHNPDVDIVLQTMNPAWDPSTGEKKPASERPQLAEYYEVYRHYAQEHKLPLVDNYPNWLGIQQKDQAKFQTMVSDGLHPHSGPSRSVTGAAVQALLEKARIASRGEQKPVTTAPDRDSVPATGLTTMPAVLSAHALAVTNTAPVVVTPPAKENFHIYLLMGQSNMVGRDTRTLDFYKGDSHILSLNEKGEWIVAKDPLHAQVGRIAVGVGPGIPFAREMLKANPEVTIGLVPCAVGGTPLRRWAKGGDLYENAINRAKVAAQTGVIKGVLWHQGETDSDKRSTAQTYEARLTQMFKDLRADLAQPELPIVVGQIGEFVPVEQHAFVDMVRAAIKHAAEVVPHVSYADSAGLVHKGDKLHFTAEAERELGARFAKAMRELQ
jgi:lysophospholipase L1-like esterase